MASGEKVPVKREHQGRIKDKKEALLILGNKVLAVADIRLHKALRGEDTKRKEIAKELMFLREFRGLPHVVQLLDVVSEKPSLWDSWVRGTTPLHQLLMEDYYGGTFESNMKNMTLSAKRVVIRDIMEAVSAIHQQGVVHSDLKPKNVFLREGRGYVGDFDGSFRKGEEWTGGTRQYNAPEAFQTCIDYLLGRGDKGFKEMPPRMDAFSLGVLMAESLFNNRWTETPSEICDSASEVLMDKTVRSPSLLLSKGIISGNDNTLWKEQIRNYFESHSVADLYREYLPSFQARGADVALVDSLLKIAKMEMGIT